MVGRLNEIKQLLVRLVDYRKVKFCRLDILITFPGVSLIKLLSLRFVKNRIGMISLSTNNSSVNTILHVTMLPPPPHPSYSSAIFWTDGFVTSSGLFDP